MIQTSVFKRFDSLTTCHQFTSPFSIYAYRISRYNQTYLLYQIFSQSKKKSITNEKHKAALDSAVERFLKLSPAEFRAKLKEHKNGVLSMSNEINT
jgi:hypothetical protein